MHAINILKQTRTVLLKIFSDLDLSEEQLLFIPKGFRNNILWNLGHLIVTQQMLHYLRSGQEMHIPPTLVDQFRRGTSPADWTSTPQISMLLPLLIELPNQLEIDYQEGKFKTYKELSTSSGVVLSNIEDAISYNNYHEGMHTGIMLSMKKLLP